MRFLMSKRETIWRIIAVITCVALFSCGPSEQKNSAAIKKPRIDTLPSDPVKAELELERRLDASVRVQDGFIVLSDPFMRAIGETTVLPINTPWVLHCGGVLSIRFGTSVSGADGDVSNDDEVQLSRGDVISRKTCDQIELPLANHLRTTLVAGTPQITK